MNYYIAAILLVAASTVAAAENTVATDFQKSRILVDVVASEVNVAELTIA